VVGSEKTVPSRSLPIRRMGISLGMREVKRTTCYGKGGASPGRNAKQFGTYEDLGGLRVFQIGTRGKVRK
jgi:hypothetical protein